MIQSIVVIQIVAIYVYMLLLNNCLTKKMIFDPKYHTV